MLQTNNEERPLISIITPVYNRADYLAETIESVLAQTYSNWEMIIIDDGSETTDSRIVAEPFCQKDKRISYHYVTHIGLSGARNHGILLSKGKYIAFLDSDDRYLPNALEVFLSGFTRSNFVGKLVYANFIKYFENDGSQRLINCTPPLPRPSLFFQFIIPGANPIAPSACIVEKETLLQLGGFNIFFSAIEDRELWSRLVINNDIIHINTPTTLYRVHKDQMTDSKNRADHRVESSRQVYTALTLFKLEQLFPKAKNNKELAMALDDLANRLLNAPKTPFEVALYLYKLAQKKAPSKKREIFIVDLEEKIPQILLEKFDSNEQIKVPENLLC